MAEEDVTFDLDLGATSHAEQDIGKLLVKEMNNELVEEARPLVQERYASFVANLPDLVKRHYPNVADDLKDDWMKEYYFTTLRDFMHHKKNSKDGVLLVSENFGCSAISAACGIDLHKRVGDLSVQELRTIVTVVEAQAEQAAKGMPNSFDKFDRAVQPEVMEEWGQAKWRSPSIYHRPPGHPGWNDDEDRPIKGKGKKTEGKDKVSEMMKGRGKDKNPPESAIDYRRSHKDRDIPIPCMATRSAQERRAQKAKEIHPEFVDSSDEDAIKLQAYSGMTIQRLQRIIHPELVSAEDENLPVSELAEKMRAKAAASDRCAF